MDDLTKMIVIPFDGSRNAMRSLDYLNLMYGPTYNLKVTLLHMMPHLPSILSPDDSIDKYDWSQISAAEKKNMQLAEQMLAKAKGVLVEMGFEEERIQTVFRKKERDVAMDACRWSQNKEADAVLLARHGRTGLDDLFMGEISKKVVDHCQFCPVWIVDGKIDSNNVLLCIDNSENALRAVDHAGFMLAGTESRVTLFYSMPHLIQLFPLEVIEDASDLDELWKEKAGKQIASSMINAREMLLNAGFTENRITVKVVDGGRSPADDILEEARKNDFGTLILGRRGLSAFKEFFMGSVTSKVLSRALGLATWIVQ